MAQQKKRIFWIGFARVCAKSLFCQGFTAKRNDAQKTQSMHYGSCSALLLLQKADRQPPLHEKGAAARISGVVRRLRPFCHRCPGASGRTPQKCTTPAKHGAQYPRAVDLPELPQKPSGFGGFTMPKVGFYRCAISLSNTFLTKGIMSHKRIKVSVKSTLVIG